MPSLLQSAQLKPDVTITSADSDNDIEESDDERFAFLFFKVHLTSIGNAKISAQIKEAEH